MKCPKTAAAKYVFIITVMAVFTLFSSDVLATEQPNASQWRPTYDLIMMWVNFGIFVFVAVKFGKTPLMNFLRSRKEELAEEINKIETKRAQAAAKVDACRKMLEESETRLSDLRARIIKEGERKKLEIIADAQNESQMMLNDAERRMQYQVLLARDKFKAQLIDMAVDLATEKLCHAVTDQDNRKLLDNYLSHVNTPS
jgi:F-type H+-transporting ATPase subunit b